jgi:hypothetical protein
VVAAACSQRGGCAAATRASAPDARAEEACATWASHHCRRLEACAPVSLAAGYGDLAACVSRQTDVCRSALQAPGTGATPATVEACARAYDTASCEEIDVGRAPPGCATSGSLQAGAACGDDSQCAGADDPAPRPGGGLAADTGGAAEAAAARGSRRRYCQMAADEACGTCAAVGGAGDACDSDRDCEHGLVCYFTCLEPVAEGQPCDGMTRQCAQTLVCLDYRCVRPGAEGAPCTPRADSCDHDEGLFCDLESAKCAHYLVAAPGSPCGAGTLCRAGSCPPGDGTQTSRCVANAADGARCDAADGPFCTPPARCVDGQCVPPRPAGCR